MSTIGFGNFSLASRSRVPMPPQRMTTGMSCGSVFGELPSPPGMSDVTVGTLPRSDPGPCPGVRFGEGRAVLIHTSCRRWLSWCHVLSVVNR
jgi:hypothetical protein